MDTSGKRTARQQREQRLSEALRENLKRRKVQARGRRDAQSAESGIREGAGEATDAGISQASRLSPQSRPD
jgi:hypothetical protein